MKILSVSFCLSVVVALCSCQPISSDYFSQEKMDKNKTEKSASTKHAEWKPPRLTLQKPTDQPKPAHRATSSSNLEGIFLRYDKYGSTRVSMTRNVANDTKGLRNKLLDTISGKEGRESTALALVYPRSETFPLGTILEKSRAQGFDVTYDTSYAPKYQNKVQTNKFKSSIVSGFINGISQKMLLRPHKRAALFAELAEPNPISVTSIGTTVNVMSARVETLPYSASRKLAKHLLEAGVQSDEGYYFVADKIIWAMEISYFVGPGRIKKHPLNRHPTSGIDPQDIKFAKQNGVNIKDVNGVKVITETFDEEKIVAVGFSILPNLSKLGDRKIINADHPILADTYYTHSTPMGVLH